MKKYCACFFKNNFRVGFMGPCGDFHPLGDISDFSTFDEANKVAFDIANGKYAEYDCGEYINMR